MGNTKRNILITNDDGIESPGLLALANELVDLGNIWMVAPSQQFSGAGRASLMFAKGHPWHQHWIATDVDHLLDRVFELVIFLEFGIKGCCQIFPLMMD